MPIAKLKPSNTTPIKPHIPKHVPPSYKTVTINEKEIPKHQLLAYISGSSWSVNYYQQVLGEDDDVKEYDPDQSPIYQQYNLIRNLELRVDGELSNEFDSEKNLTSITGSANIYPSVIPNVGDLFVAECGKGRVGLFSISDVDRKSFNRQSVFGIRYSCIAFLDQSPHKFKDLKNKVIREYIFNKDRLLNNGVPVLTIKENNQYVSLISEYKRMVKYYINNFFEDDINTFAIPGQTTFSYDHYVAEFIIKIIGTEDLGNRVNLRLWNVERDRYLNQPQLYTALLDRDYDLLHRCNKYIALTSVNAFSMDSTLQSIRYSYINYIMYPKYKDETVLATTLVKSRSGDVVSLKEVASGTADVNALLGDGELMFKDNLIKNVTCDDYYVFSKEFYEDKPGQSLIEELTIDYLKCRAIDINKLYKLCTAYRSWGRLEQFYYIPILIMLIKTTKLDLY